MEPTIRLAPNGPVLVSDLKKLTSPDGDIDQKESFALCRCGHSETKPFCDGAHKRVGWTDAKERTETYPTKEYPGKDVTVVDNIGICCHAGACVRGAPNVFFTWEDGKRVSTPDAGTKEEIIKTIRACPSGSLAYKIDKKLFDEFFEEPEIFIEKDGPLHIRGKIPLDDASASELISKEHFTLCRCGASKNKPFCDGMHKKSGFKG